MKICSEPNYNIDADEFRKAGELHEEKKSCMFNCANKFELALGHVENYGKTTPYYAKNFQEYFTNKYNEDKKVENLINSLY